MILPAVPYLLRVFTFGLIAYVTNVPGRPNEVTLLLVDARHPPVGTDGCPISKHEPLLIYAPHEGKCNDWCRLEMGVCRCPLERVRVQFEVEADPSVFGRDDFDHEEMKYVPDLLRLFRRRQVKYECLYQNDGIQNRSYRVCPFVTAQARVTPFAIHTCELAVGMRTTKEGGAHYARPKRGETTQPGRPFAFRSASQGEY